MSVNQRTMSINFEGSFSTKSVKHLVDSSAYTGLAYYGEYPLAFTACFSNKKIYDYLIQKGADPNLQGKAC